MTHWQPHNAGLFFHRKVREFRLSAFSQLSESCKAIGSERRDGRGWEPQAHLGNSGLPPASPSLPCRLFEHWSSITSSTPPLAQTHEPKPRPPCSPLSQRLCRKDAVVFVDLVRMEGGLDEGTGRLRKIKEAGGRGQRLHTESWMKTFWWKQWHLCEHLSTNLCRLALIWSKYQEEAARLQRNGSSLKRRESRGPYTSMTHTWGGKLFHVPQSQTEQCQEQKIKATRRMVWPHPPISYPPSPAPQWLPF